jgi:hypothetical protein
MHKWLKKAGDNIDGRRTPQLDKGGNETCGVGGSWTYIETTATEPTGQRRQSRGNGRYGTTMRYGTEYKREGGSTKHRADHGTKKYDSRMFRVY